MGTVRSSLTPQQKYKSSYSKRFDDKIRLWRAPKAAFVIKNGVIWQRGSSNDWKSRQD